jgi:hypothetical protein
MSALYEYPYLYLRRLKLLPRSSILAQDLTCPNTKKTQCGHDVLASNALFAQASQAIDAAAALDPSYTIKEEPIGTRRPIRVVCMGAGYSGLMMAIMFSQKMQRKNAELVVYERNDDLGGTWLLNRYAQPIHHRDAHRLTLLCV